MITQIKTQSLEAKANIRMAENMFHWPQRYLCGVEASTYLPTYKPITTHRNVSLLTWLICKSGHLKHMAFPFIFQKK